MKIIIETIPHKDQRYPTVGDWQFHNKDCSPLSLKFAENVPEFADHLHIKVSDTGNDWMNFLVARHELDEAMICARLGVTQEQVDKYDLAHPEAGVDCFSDNLDAPYSTAHNLALASEYQMSQVLGIDWREYSNKLDELSDSK